MIKNWGSSCKINKFINIKRLCIQFKMNGNDGFMRRFGGGWNWKLGLQASTPNKYGWTILFNLLIATLSISWKTQYAKAIEKETTPAL